MDHGCDSHHSIVAIKKSSLVVPGIVQLASCFPDFLHDILPSHDEYSSTIGHNPFPVTNLPHVYPLSQTFQTIRSEIDNHFFSNVNSHSCHQLRNDPFG